MGMALAPWAMVVDEGMSCRAAARRFGVADATVIRWHDQRRRTGDYAAKAQGGDTRSRRIEAHAHTILALHEARRDITLDELRRELGKAGVAAAAPTEPDRLSVRAIQNYAGRLRDQPFLLQTGTFDPWTTPEATKQLLRAPGHTNERAEGVPQRPPPPHMIYQ